MFEEEIAHAKSMITRMNDLEELSYHEVEHLKIEKKVPIFEIKTWEESIEMKLRNNFGEYTFKRYEIIKDLFKKDIDLEEDKSSYEHHINNINRIVLLLEELDQLSFTC